MNAHTDTRIEYFIFVETNGRTPECQINSKQSAIDMVAELSEDYDLDKCFHIIVENFVPNIVDISDEVFAKATADTLAYLSGEAETADDFAWAVQTNDYKGRLGAELAAA